MPAPHTERPLRPAAGPRRNGLPGTGPEFRPYTYGTGDARRLAEVERILASVRAHVAGEPAPAAALPPVEPGPAPGPEPAPEPAVTARCGRCGYLLTRCCCKGGPRS